MNKSWHNNSFVSFALIMGIFSVVISCSTKSDGDWDDIIQLSQKEAIFNGISDSITITTKGDWWWINNVSLDDDYISLEGISTTSNSFVIKENEFEIIRINQTEIKVKMFENQTENLRILIIGIQAGNYYDGIKIVQERK